MAKIPTSTDAGFGAVPFQPATPVPVRSSPLAPVGGTPGAFGAGIGGALEQLSAVGQQAGGVAMDIATDLQIEQTEREAKEADMRYSKRIRELMFGTSDEPGFYGLEGKAAVEAHSTSVAALEAAREEIAAALGNEAARRMFNDSSSVRLDQELNRVAVHAFKQGKIANQEASEARRNEFIDDGVARYNDPNARKQSLEAGAAEVVQFEQDRGTEQEVIQSRVEEYRTLFHAAIVDRILADQDPVAAMAYFEANKTDIDGRNHAKILEAIARETTTQASSLKRSVREEIAALSVGSGSSSLLDVKAALDAFPVGADAGLDNLRADFYDALADQPIVAAQMKRPLGEVDEFLATFRARLSSTDPDDRPSIDEIRRFEKIEKAAAEQRKMFNDGDGLQFAANQGIVEPLEPVDFMDPTSLEKRRIAADVASEVYGVDVSPLLDADIDAFIDTVTGEGEATPPAIEDVNTMLANMHVVMGEDGAAFVVRDIIEKDHPSLAIALQVAGERPDVAMDLIRGQRFLNENPEFKISDRDNLERGADTFGNLFTPDTAAARGDIMAAANALYAIRAQQAGSTDYDSAIHEQAILDTVGGIVEHNGRKVIPPEPNMSQSTFDALMREVKNSTLLDDQGRLPKFADGTDFTADMLRQSIWRDEAVLVSTSMQGTYNILLPGVGYVQNADQTEVYELDLRSAFAVDRFRATSAFATSLDGVPLFPETALPEEVEAATPLADQVAGGGAGGGGGGAFPAPVRDAVVPEAVTEPEETIEQSGRKSPPPTPVQTPAGRQPRGLRNNNPGNIERNDIVWQGMAEDQSGDDRFVVFSHPRFGVRAMARVLQTYSTKHGLNTVREIVNRWAPPNENQTNAYVSSVADRMGVSPTAKLNLGDDNVMKDLIAAIIFHENGEQPFDDRLILQGIGLAR